MRKMTTLFRLSISTFLLLVVLLAGCSSGRQLTETEWDKLDSDVRRLLETNGELVSGMRVTRGSDAVVRYALIVHCTDAKVLREVGINVDTEANGFVTARLILEEIRLAARQTEVNRIENGTVRRPY